MNGELLKRQDSMSMTNAGRYFGRLWSRGFESLLCGSPGGRSILRISGNNSGQYLQGLVTSDVLKIAIRNPPKSEIPIITDDNETPVPEFNPKLQPTTFLDERGRLISDGMLWKNTSAQTFYLEVPESSSQVILEHLQGHKVGRSNKTVEISDVTNSQSSIHVIHGTLLSSPDQEDSPLQTGLDPRHPSLGLRLLSNFSETSAETRHAKLSQMLNQTQFPNSPGTYELLRHLNGIAEGHDELNGKTPLECNFDFLGDSISFHKGCYLGQELTARSFYKGVVRKRILPIFFIDTRTELPFPWKQAYKQYRDKITSAAESKSNNKDDEFEDEILQTESFPPALEFLPLPRLGVYDAAGVMSILQGIQPNSLNSVKNMPNNDAEPIIKEVLNSQANLDLLQELQTHAIRGNKIFNQANGQTVGEIISMRPFGNSSLVLAQLRLEYIHLLQTKDEVNHHDEDVDHTKWRPNNKVRVGESKMEFRMLPYVPLWWPNVDRATGKAIKE